MLAFVIGAAECRRFSKDILYSTGRLCPLDKGLDNYVFLPKLNNLMDN